jgi:ADP-ribose 1''-phosphate phosphatase
VELRNLSYLKGNLFNFLTPEVYACHACNAQGVWGAGIAKSFREFYPEDYLEYKQFCNVEVVGTSLITKNNIICMITSCFYDKDRKSLGDTVLNNTYTALMDLETILPMNSIVYSNKFNSGLFNVPWEMTEYFLKCFLKRRPDVKWTVVEWME